MFYVKTPYYYLLSLVRKENHNLPPRPALLQKCFLCPPPPPPPPLVNTWPPLSSSCRIRWWRKRQCTSTGLLAWASLLKRLAVGGLLSSSSLLPDIEVSSPSVPFGFVLQKHERLTEPDDYDRRSVKARPEALAAAPAKEAPFLLKTNSCPLFPHGGQMLSFSSRSKSGMVVGADGTLPYYNQPSATSASAQCYIPRNAGNSCQYGNSKSRC